MGAVKQNGFPDFSGNSVGVEKPRITKPSKPARPRPANDNVRIPANDNAPRRAARRAIVRGISKRGLALGVARRVLPKFVPVLGTVLTAIELVEWYKGQYSPPGYNMTGWTRVYGPFLWPIDYPPASPTVLRQPIDRPSPTNYVPNRETLGPLDGQGANAAALAAGRAAWSWVGKTSVTFQEPYVHSALSGEKSRVITGHRRATVTSAPDPLPTNDPVALPTARRSGNLQPAPQEIPNWADPMGMPIGQPVATPVAPPYWVIPYRQPDPGRSPHEQTVIGPSPAVRTRPDYSWPGRFTRPSPRPSPGPGVNPFPRPGDLPVIVPPTVETGGLYKPRPRKRPDASKRPGWRSIPNWGPQNRTRSSSDTTERKVKMSRGKLVIGLVVIAGHTTEFLDVLNAAYDALPKSCKPGYYKLRKKGGTFYKRRWRANQSQRAGAVKSCFSHMDMNEFMKNLLTNQGGDWFGGRTGKLARQSNAASGSTRPVGLQAGPWDTIAQKQHTEYNRAEQERKDAAYDAAHARKLAAKKILSKSKAIEKKARRFEYKTKYTLKKLARASTSAKNSAMWKDAWTLAKKMASIKAKQRYKSMTKAQKAAERKRIEKFYYDLDFYRNG